MALKNRISAILSGYNIDFVEFEVRIFIPLLRILIAAFTIYATTQKIVAQNIIDKANLVSNVLSSRKMLPSEYHLEFKRESKSSEAGKAENSESSIISVWSRGSLLRTDVSKIVSTRDKQHVGRRSITCRNCERPGFALFTKVGSKDSISLVQFEKLDAAFDARDNWRIDWRGLGLLPDDLSGYRTTPVTSLLDQITRVRDCKIESIEREGSACYVVTIPVVNKSGGSASRKSWYCRDFGMNPIRFEDSGGLLQVTDITYQKLKGIDTWFPMTIHHVRTQNGKIIFDEMLVVELMNFGDHISDEIFQLAGLKLDEGQPVRFPEIKNLEESPVWRNGKLDRNYTAVMQTIDSMDFRAKQLDLQPIPDVDTGTSRWIYYFGAGVLALVGIVIAYFARRTSKRSA